MKSASDPNGCLHPKVQSLPGRLEKLHSTRCVLYSVNFDEIERYQKTDDWKSAGRVLADAAARLEKAGAHFIVLCTNTMHKVADENQGIIGIPILPIAEAKAEIILKKNIITIGLLRTRYTMEHEFYESPLEEKGIRMIILEEKDRAIIQRLIYEELCLGKILVESRANFRNIINNLGGRGAEGIVLGCTEIGLLVEGKDNPVPLFDTADIHARTAGDLRSRLEKRFPCSRQH